MVQISSTNKNKYKRGKILVYKRSGELKLCPPMISAFPNTTDTFHINKKKVKICSSCIITTLFSYFHSHTYTIGPSIINYMFD
jgi:hypothetical protein